MTRVHCARCGKPVTKRSITAALSAVIAGQTVKATATFGPSCARKLGLSNPRTTRRYAVATPRPLEHLPVHEALPGQLSIDDIDIEGDEP